MGLAALLWWYLNHRTSAKVHLITGPDFGASFRDHIQITVYGAIVVYGCSDCKCYSLESCSICLVHYFSSLLSIHLPFEYFSGSLLVMKGIGWSHLLEPVSSFALQRWCSMFLRVYSRIILIRRCLGHLLILTVSLSPFWSSGACYHVQVRRGHHLLSVADSLNFHQEADQDLVLPNHLCHAWNVSL